MKLVLLTNPSTLSNKELMFYYGILESAKSELSEMSTRYKAKIDAELLTRLHK